MSLRCASASVTLLSQFHPLSGFAAHAPLLRGSTEAQHHRDGKVSIGLVGRESNTEVHRSMNISTRSSGP